ncbi:hypothetical protein P152DRAFT_47290 [Eremomyces bilateralis CBS 781.70]|uniref:Uncharacterized protein n=1 Tax=Eremomyces bilateralis CBS 781.70 TaxID=1392243 RepID=A0A6G1G1Z7_9PEZI|nr:uncharacterized protein P152DRAFT_47290 [Eremomyces bilateralis CBS 781.70]KAF1812135.1 hypothetical protein P152DRAFT_47290 [Eremomyces bilateralis CBS 781.70]
MVKSVKFILATMGFYTPLLKDPEFWLLPVYSNHNEDGPEDFHNDDSDIDNSDFGGSDLDDSQF